MIYTKFENNEFFENDQFNYDALEQITNSEVTEKVKELLISPVTKISVEESQLKMVHIGICSTMFDVIYILFDSHYNSFQFNFVPAFILSHQLELKITPNW